MKLQPPSGTELPAFNPIVHPSAITQVLLLANPQKVTAQTLGCEQAGLAAWAKAWLPCPTSLYSLQLPRDLSGLYLMTYFSPLLTAYPFSRLQEKVRLRYKLTFTIGEQTYNEMGDVDQFPPPESWGNL